MPSGKKKLAAQQNCSSQLCLKKVGTVPHLNLNFEDRRALQLKKTQRLPYTMYISILGEFYFQQKFVEDMHGFVGWWKVGIHSDLDPPLTNMLWREDKWFALWFPLLKMISWSLASHIKIKFVHYLHLMCQLIMCHFIFHEQLFNWCINQAQAGTWWHHLFFL